MCIVIMGGTGAGKSTVGQIVSQRTGYPLYEVGHVVKRLYRESVELELGQFYTSADIVQEKIRTSIEQHSKDFFTRRRLRYTSEMVRLYGNDYFVRSLLQTHPGENLILVGVRTSEEIRAIHALTGRPYLVALTCGTDRLLSRFVERERRFMEQSTAQTIFDKRYETERARGLEDVLIECDLLLSTDVRMPEQLADEICVGYARFLKTKFLTKIK